MKTVTIELPVLFGDHHVTEVRRLLLEVPGVEDVYASSCFQIAEISFDETEAKGADFEAKLAAAGYMGELPIAIEVGALVDGVEERPYFRYSASYEQTKKTVGFAQSVHNQGRPLWPCPGMGPLKPVNGGE